MSKTLDILAPAVLKWQPMTANTTVLAPEIRDGLQALMGKLGVAQAARFLEVSRPTLERAAGGLTVQRCTAKALRAKVEEREKASAP